MIVQSLVEKYPPLVSLVCTMALPTATPRHLSDPTAPTVRNITATAQTTTSKTRPTAQGAFMPQDALPDGLFGEAYHEGGGD